MKTEWQEEVEATLKNIIEAMKLIQIQLNTLKSQEKSTPKNEGENK